MLNEVGVVSMSNESLGRCWVSTGNILKPDLKVGCLYTKSMLKPAHLQFEMQGNKHCNIKELHTLENTTYKQNSSNELCMSSNNVKEIIEQKTLS